MSNKTREEEKLKKKLKANPRIVDKVWNQIFTDAQIKRFNETLAIPHDKKSIREINKIGTIINDFCHKQDIGKRDQELLFANLISNSYLNCILECTDKDCQQKVRKEFGILPSDLKRRRND